MAGEEEELAEVELEVAAILCGLKSILRARDRRREAPEIPSWGRRRLRSVLEDSKPSAAAAEGAAERDGAASPDTPLAFPESGGDDALEEEVEDANKATAQAEEQRGVVANLAQEKTHLLKEIEEYRARLQSSRSANESLMQLHKVRQNREQQARKLRVAPAPAPAPADPRHPALALGLDLNEPARAPEEEDAVADEEWYRRRQLQRAAAARRRRLEYLRAKVGSPLVSCRTRRVAG